MASAEQSVPDWAIERARELHSGKGLTPILHTFAAYIAAHEKAPVDLLYEALKAVVELGRYDTREQTQLLRGELKSRGLEIVATQP